MKTFLYLVNAIVTLGWLPIICFIIGKVFHKPTKYWWILVVLGAWGIRAPLKDMATNIPKAASIVRKYDSSNAIGKWSMRTFGNYDGIRAYVSPLSDRELLEIFRLSLGLLFIGLGIPYEKFDEADIASNDLS